jgi:hypothetical protein
MAKEPEDQRPMWSGNIGEDLVATMTRYGTDPNDRDEMFQICSILMIALLRGELAKGTSLADLDQAIEGIADLQHRALRDFDIVGGTTMMPDGTFGCAIAVYPDEQQTH